MRPCSATNRSLATTTAAAPSLSDEELPAVTSPSAWLTGLSRASTSRLVSARGPSSTANSPPLTGTGTISAANRPFFTASTARSCERSAKASSSSRVSCHCSATRSAVCGIDNVVSASKRGLGKRQPIEVSYDAPGFANARLGFSVTHGARVIDSTPPATTRSASPAAIICRAVATAVSPEAHSRLTVKPGTESGKPGEQHGHPRDVAVVLAGLVGGAQHHLVDEGGVDAGPAYGLPHHQRGQVVGAGVGQGPAVAADRGADTVEHEGLGHGHSPGCRVASPGQAS